jgi:hypothetical protein
MAAIPAIFEGLASALTFPPSPLCLPSLRRHLRRPLVRIAERFLPGLDSSQGSKPYALPPRLVRRTIPIAHLCGHSGLGNRDTRCCREGQ